MVLFALLLLYLFALPVHAATLENPAKGATKSGVDVIFGWKCTANGNISIRFNGTQTFRAAYGTVREDTRRICNDDDNGYAFLWNWNRLGNGTHLVEVLDNGVVFDSAVVTVVTLGEEFLRGASGSSAITLSTGHRVTVEWSEPNQGFIITEVEGGQSGPIPQVAGTWRFRGDLVTNTCRVIDAPATATSTLVLRQADSLLTGTVGSLEVVGTLRPDGGFGLIEEDPQATSSGGCVFLATTLVGGNFLDGNALFLFVAERVSGNCVGLSLPCEVDYLGTIARD